MDLCTLGLLVTVSVGPQVPQLPPTVPLPVVQHILKAQRPDRAADWLTVAYGGLVGADIGMTMACVANGTCYEANPVLRPLADHPAWFGGVKAALNTGLVLAVRHYTRPRSWPRYLGLGVLVAGQAVVVGLNAYRLK